MAAGLGMGNYRDKSGGLGRGGARGGRGKHRAQGRQIGGSTIMSITITIYEAIYICL
jgi:hypothetical protein